MNAFNRQFQAAARQYDNASPDESEDDTLERFADLPDARRAELLWDFLDLKIEVTGTLARRIPVFGGTSHLYVVRTDLADSFADWLVNEGHMQPEGN